MQQEDHKNNKILSLLKTNKIANFIDGITVEENKVYCVINATGLNSADANMVADTLKTLLFQHYPDYQVSCSFIKDAPKKNLLPPKQQLPNIKHIIGIASGKGGVGKSTLSVNLAYALSKNNLRVGIMDADLYGPSIHFMLNGQNINNNPNKLPLFLKQGLSYTSIAMLLKQEADPILLKAPIVVKILKQLLQETPWEPLDILIIDLPPGTGDINLHLALNYELTGIISICTPQKLAVLDLQKALNMYKKTNTPILGIIENMSSFVCPHCLTISNIFDNNTLATLASQQGIPFLGNIPLTMALRTYADNGEFILDIDPNGMVSTILQTMAHNLQTTLNKL